jgi:hypothetical protein
MSSPTLSFYVAVAVADHAHDDVDTITPTTTSIRTCRDETF